MVDRMVCPAVYGLVFLLCLTWGGECSALASAPHHTVQPLLIETSGGAHPFQVEMADDPATRSKGLMHRRELAPDAGMLFDFGAPMLVHMWMKNTLIPLDMLFIRPDGTIAHIEEWTTPHSLEPISSGEPVLAVLELKGGTADRLGIRVDDVVRHSLFKNTPE